MGHSFAERLAISLMALSLAVGAVLGVATIRSYTNTGTLVSNGAQQGGVEATQSGQQGSAAASGSGAAAGSTSTSAASGGGGSAANVSSSAGGSGISGGGCGKGGGTIKVGGFFDITGAVDSSVERDTVRAYLNKINDAGGVNCRTFQYFWCDSKYDANAAHACAEQLIQDQVVAVVGWTAPQGEDGEVADFTQAGIPMIGGLGTPAEFKSPISYPTSVSFTNAGNELAAQAQALGIKRPSIVLITDIPWVKPVEAALLRTLKNAGVDYSDVEEAQSTAPNYDQYVLGAAHGSGHNPTCDGCPPADPCKVGEANCPDNTIAALDPYSYVKLFQAMQRANYYPPKGVLASGVDKGVFQNAYQQTGEMKNLHSLVPFVSPYDHQSNATVQDYLSTVKKYYPNQVVNLDIYTQIAWSAAQVFVDAAKRAGSNLTRQSLINALNSTSNFDTGWSKPLSYSSGSSHDPNHCFQWMVWNGAWQNMDENWRCV